MSASSWIESTLRKWQEMKVPHHHYVANVQQLQLALFAAMPGEIITLVGPTRVGKTRSLREAMSVAYPSKHKNRRSVIFVEAENASKNGEFSTKAFTVQCLRAIEHPMFCEQDMDDPLQSQYRSRVHRATEGVLRDAFEGALSTCRTEVLVVDEAHHIQYAPGGSASAARILDSLKCLANKTQIKLVLAGSYALLDVVALAPHLLGRQHPLEFPRYKITSSEDVAAWKQLLHAFNEGLEIDTAAGSLQAWAKLLFEGSFGCAGHLSRWLRSCLAYTASHSLPYVTEAALIATCLPDAQAKELANEILAGERSIARLGTTQAERFPPNAPSAKPAKGQPKPFQRKPRRSPRGGRS